jgi:hypothetical protein
MKDSELNGICLSVCLSVHPCIYLSIYLSIYQYFNFSGHLAWNDTNYRV